MSTQYLTPRQFAEAIGVSESSVRRWADDGRIRITRTAGGHRKIPRSEAIRFIRQSGAEIVRPELLDIGEPPHRRRRQAAFAAQHEELLSALEKGDSELVTGLLTRMHLHGVDAAEICDGPLRYALQRIGEKWPADERAILVEHRATNICIDALSRLRSTFPRAGDDAPLAVGGAPEGDPYVLPSLMASTTLADVGWRPVNLGPHTPLKVLAQSALELNARLVWIAATAPLPKAALEEALAQLARRLSSSRAAIVIGGRSAGRYRLPPASHVHMLAGMRPLAGFAQGLLAHPRRASRRRSSTASSGSRSSGR